MKRARFPVFAASIQGAIPTAIALAVAHAVTASAADAPSASSATLDEVVVTAEFRERSLQDTPLAISAVSGEMLEARGQVEITDIANNVPSTWLTEGRGQFGSGLVAFMRGIGQFNSTPAFEPGVGIYIDDVYMATMQANLFNLLDLDRVEVLRGPQGTLSGKNSIGGAIKLFSKKPTGEGGGYAQLGYGSYNQVRAKAAGDFKLTDTLFARVNVAAQNEDGYVKILDYGCVNLGSGLPQRQSPSDGCKTGTAQGVSYAGGRVALRWLASDAVEVNLTGDYTNDSSQAGGDQLTAITNPLAVPPSTVNGVGVIPGFITAGTYNTFADYCNIDATNGAYCNAPVGSTDTWGSTGTIDIAFSDNASLKTITSYRGYRARMATDNDGTPIPLGNHRVSFHGNQFSQELRLNANLSETMNFTIGGYYLKSKVNNDSRIDIQYLAFLDLVFLNNDNTPSSSKAGYAQLQFDPTDRLHLTGGIRYTTEKKSYTFFRTRPDGTNSPIAPLFGLNANYDGNKWDYRANVSFDVTDDFMVYGQYATGFKGGGSNSQPFFPDQASITFGPEALKTIEVGAKFQALDGRVTLNGDIYRSTYTDIQLQALTCPAPSTPFPCAAALNVGSAHIKGVEAELSLEPAQGFNIDASVSYLDFEYYRLLATAVALDMVSPYTPKMQWNVGAQYKLPFVGGSLTPRLDATHRSSIYVNPVNAPTNFLPSRTLINARLGWESADKDWEAALEVTNLGDKHYYDNWIDNSPFVGLTFGYPAPPRRWTVSIKRNF
jgi:iron complex outermembrane receptor protein